MAGCEAFVDFDDRNQYCGEPPVGTVFAACLHEHVNERPVCMDCAARLAEEGYGDWTCAHCSESARSHDCPLQLEIRYSDGVVVVLQKL